MPKNNNIRRTFSTDLIYEKPVSPDEFSRLQAKDRIASRVYDIIDAAVEFPVAPVVKASEPKTEIPTPVEAASESPETPDSSWGTNYDRKIELGQKLNSFDKLEALNATGKIVLSSQIEDRNLDAQAVLSFSIDPDRPLWRQRRDQMKNG